MKLDVSLLKYLSRDDFRVLTAIEMGMKNHEIVPVPLICSISNLKRRIVFRSITTLHKNKLLYHEAKSYDGYRLTYQGYDFLSLRAMILRSSVTGLGNQIGVGKESDIYSCTNEAGEELCVKFHRLGRTSFRAIKRTRDYMGKRKSASWFYISRLASVKEYAFMKALYDNDFPVPRPVDHSRHGVIMERINGYPMIQVSELGNPGRVFHALMQMIIRLARYGLIHGDFNEFNVLIDDDENITVIDFPQMVSTTHFNADFYFNRDVQCIKIWFEKKYNFVSSSPLPVFEDYCTTRDFDLDKEVEASGFTKSNQEEMDKLIAELEKDEEDKDDEDDTDDEDGEEEESEGEEVEQDNVDELPSISLKNKGLTVSFQKMEINSEEPETHEDEDQDEDEDDEEDEEEEDGDEIELEILRSKQKKRTVNTEEEEEQKVTPVKKEEALSKIEQIKRQILEQNRGENTDRTIQLPSIQLIDEDNEQAPKEENSPTDPTIEASSSSSSFVEEVHNDDTEDDPEKGKEANEEDDKLETMSQTSVVSSATGRRRKAKIVYDEKTIQENVKKCLKKRNKVNLKRNENKSRSKRELSRIVKSDAF
eukprot:CAMPEP_0184338842 /NCGR_PEP_ID=MMETSP1089-20130417/7459_1 /TAXON_ID=38269 ORGANISM="Gloeochaete wittrockiana, Strain SAG46.84" /NCGR_SAMPLE_ID=MMETSP1089 /ASSEMBLY_ACC=CAM_ASM_000445 /LENGTH=591 /DNA_ID=CAMNT_0026665663 /DNA_START=9 /DNA_END=1784 /DNA_ORIENTATION=-